MTGQWILNVDLQPASLGESLDLRQDGLESPPVRGRPGKKVVRGGFEPPTRGFSVPADDPAKRLAGVASEVEDSSVCQNEIPCPTGTRHEESLRHRTASGTTA